MTAVETLGAIYLPDAKRFCHELGATDDVDRVGGKASALGRMKRAGMNVPNGFALTVDALEAHLADSGIDAQIADLCAALDTTDGEALARTARRLRSLVRDAVLPDIVREQLSAAARVLLDRGAVVVRSSAVGEDGPGQSFAGQLDSILHVRDEGGLEQAVVDVWSSFWSERALFYRSARQVPARGMGVVVQQQVDAIAAGVLFTSTTSGEMLVEFVPGLGDALVSGAIDPGRLAIDRVSDTVIRLADAAYPSGEPYRLDQKVVDALREVGLTLEGEFGAPQDVEWVLSVDGTLFVVQSRPITAPVTIEYPRALASQKPVRRVAWSNANVNENFPRPISPLLYSIASVGYTHYFRNLANAFGIAPRRVRAMEPAFQQIIGVHAARMYYNLTSIHSVLRLAPFGAALTASFDTFVGADGRDIAAETAGRSGRLREAAEVALIAVKAARRFLSIDRGVRRFERVADDFALRTDPSRLDAMTLSELRDALTAFMEIRRHKWLDASLADAASMLCYGALERLLTRAYPDAGRGSVHTSLLKAIPNVVSGKPVMRLWELSRLVRAEPELLALFESAPASEVLGAVETDVRFVRFRVALRAYLDEWGFRCSEELMLTSPSFQENPAPIVDMIRAYAAVDGDSPTDALRAQGAERERETARVMDDLRGRAVWRAFPVVSYAVLLGVLLPWTHAAIRFRERARLKQALLYSRCRRVALAIGSSLMRAGSIAERDDVFFLTVGEIVELTSGGAMFPRAVCELIATRKSEHARLSALTPPDAFTLPQGEYFDGTNVVQSDATVDSNDLMRGTPACGGKVTGRATVLRDVTEASQLDRGDILVTKQTDPGWGPVFFLISGLVIERGGMLSHGAIIAREFGIPCVVGVRNAMQRIRSGATITVDGDRGDVDVVG